MNICKMSGFSQDRPRPWEIRGRTLTAAAGPLIMGIVNVTPDSFSDGGRFLDVGAACEQARQLAAEGADLLDIGGESTRPGAEQVPADDELRRVIPVVERIVGAVSIPVSIDTTKAAVAKEALRAGAHIVNDISGLTFDPEMIRVCAEYEAGVICMHIQGTPQTMQADPQYGDVVAEVREFLRARLAALEAEGIPRQRIALDPGIGFGKTAEHNLSLLANIARLHELGRPVCVGHSRKRFLKKILGRPVDERLFGTVGVSVALALQGTEILRVHDVAATRDAIVACRAVGDWRGEGGG